MKKMHWRLLHTWSKMIHLSYLFICCFFIYLFIYFRCFFFSCVCCFCFWYFCIGTFIVVQGFGEHLRSKSKSWWLLSIQFYFVSFASMSCMLSKGNIRTDFSWKPNKRNMNKLKEQRNLKGWKIDGNFYQTKTFFYLYLSYFLHNFLICSFFWDFYIESI